jgi:hypothetical protein
MAYMAFGEQLDGAVLDRPLAAIPATARAPGTAMEGFSALEWSVVALAERDSLSSLRAPGRVAIAMGALFGDRRNPQLADQGLEALRRMAVLSWHHGFAVHGRDVRAFVDAGYSLDQYETLVASIGAAKARRPRHRR